MNVFDRVSKAIGADPGHQNENGWLHAILAYGSATYAGEDVSSNPATEVVRRLEDGGVGKPTLDVIRHRLYAVESDYATGRAKV
jgi:hypothetical protein